MGRGFEEEKKKGFKEEQREEENGEGDVVNKMDKTVLTHPVNTIAE